MTEKQSHYGCKYYILQYDDCLKFHESNMSQRIKLCECSIRAGDLMTEKQFVKYDGNTIVDLKLVKSWTISNGDVDLLLDLLNGDKISANLIQKKN